MAILRPPQNAQQSGGDKFAIAIFKVPHTHNQLEYQTRTKCSMNRDYILLIYLLCNFFVFSYVFCIRSILCSTTWNIYCLASKANVRMADSMENKHQQPTKRCVSCGLCENAPVQHWIITHTHTHTATRNSSSNKIKNRISNYCEEGVPLHVHSLYLAFTPSILVYIHILRMRRGQTKPPTNTYTSAQRVRERKNAI